METGILLGFSGGEESGAEDAEIAGCTAFRAAGVTPTGVRRSRKGPTESN
jgi:hypothetical protein